MLTDLHLQKYLQGLLSEEEEKNVEALLEINPDLKKRLQELEERPSVGRPMWERKRLGRHAKRGSSVRYATVLPALLILLLIVVLSSHWFGKPGGNSTFIHAGGNATSVELLYNAPQGWRYIDAGFKPGDSLTFTVRDTGKYTVRVFGIYSGMPEAVAKEIWSSPEGLRFGSQDAEPIFSSLPASDSTRPRFLAVVFDTTTLTSLVPEELPQLLRNGGGGGRIPGFRYQVFRVPESDQ
jgi:hypothetical protein